MIPLPKDTRDAIGAGAEKVENRSLLFEKMVLTKHWGHDVERFNDANRFNVLRASTGGEVLLKKDRDEASKRSHKPDQKYKAKVADAMARVHVDSADLARRQTQNAVQLLSLIEKSFPGRSETFVATLGGRLLINMAGGVQENAGISLDRCFGLPLIPGTAVKGITRAAALWDIRRTSAPNEKREKLRMALLAFGFIGDDIHRRSTKVGDFVWAMEGDETAVLAACPQPGVESFKGILSFLPAYPAASPRIVAEVLTPHPRAGEESDPRPLFFPAVEAGSSFGFAITISWQPEGADGRGVLTQASEWLRSALTEQGAGAKTGAGYGWFLIDPQADAARRQAAAELEAVTTAARLKAKVEAEQKAAEEARKASLSPVDGAAELVRSLSQQDFAEWAKVLGQKTEVEQRAFLAVLKSAELKETRKRWKKNKPELWAGLLPVAAALGLTLE